MKKILAPSLASIFLFVCSSNVVLADYMTCDNDPPSSDTYCQGSAGENWEKYTNKPSSFNSDHRFYKGGQTFNRSRYNWTVFPLGGNSTGEYSVGFYLNSASFTGNANYYIEGMNIGGLDQNTAPVGWNNFPYKTHPWSNGKQAHVAVEPLSINSSVGADGVRVYYSTNTIVSTQENTVESENLKLDAASIKEKMLNAIDYYNYVRGSFLYDFSNSNQKYTIDFEVDQSKNLGSNIVLKDSSTKENLFRVTSSSNEIIQVDEKNKKYSKSSKTAERTKILAPRISKDKGPDGEEANQYMYRNDPANASAASTVTFPQTIAFWLDDELKNYKITGQEDLLNRKATVIEGKLSKELSEKLLSTSFKLWVDTETGILLKLNTFNVDGVVINKIVVNDISFDYKKTIFDTSNNKGYVPQQ
ncbi:hypothetical protein PC41400_23195 [Paenibacillus chitinolyticus]|uniref:Uncharacterized protein n=1 Tax=Paenibacillus chitinolyticus TaxID=79263 RepID=A0A410X1D1_9BACL|nr:hypothetical protein [Paenibacillus chitinolyticus]MCY9592500.1 hypothetical protein [Paenibacillus chitinolyticus]MCY9594897.1 hypothetical protein [Paenibacillus chitinolyticus]QAV20419.1 hypothetical protein PC41400_23195 [Paenibacillus chitinolyticus]